MRYIVVSDVHSNFDKLMEALKAVNFDPQKDCLINDGDLFDRGDKPLECLQYVMSLPHKILLFGNHELELMRLIQTGYPKEYDFHNMTNDTLLRLAGEEDETQNYIRAASFLRNKKNAVSKLLQKYFDLCHYAVILGDYVITHSWLPCTYDDEYNEIVKPEWDLSTKLEWYDACWTNPVNRCHAGAFLKGKTLVLGHRHAWRIAEAYGEKRIADDEETLNTVPYSIEGETKYIDGDGWTTTSKKAVFIDGCAPYEFGGQVNAFVIHTNKRPIKVDALPEYKYERKDD